MPIFKSTKNIFVDHGEHFDPNWMDSDRIILPDTKPWTYDRELQIEDIDLWEVISEFGGGGVYVAWQPYAEFYMIVLPQWAGGVKTFYGLDCLPQVKAYLNEKGIPWSVHKPHPAYSKIKITKDGLKYLPLD